MAKVLSMACAVVFLGIDGTKWSMVLLRCEWIIGTLVCPLSLCLFLSLFLSLPFSLFLSLHLQASFLSPSLLSFLAILKIIALLCYMFSFSVTVICSFSGPKRIEPTKQKQKRQHFCNQIKLLNVLLTAVKS